MRPERFSCRIYGVLARRRAGRVKVLLARSLFLGREFINFPGGGIELGEAPMAALKREFKEETSVSIRPLRVLYASEGLHVSTQRPWQIVSVYWLVRRVGGRLNRGGNGDDVKGTFWADAEKLPLAEMFPADREFARRLRGLL